MASPAIQPAAVVKSVTDTTTPIVLIPPRQRWWAWIPAGAALLGLVAFAVASIVPSSVIATTENPRTETQQPAPYARIPAGTESVNDRVEYSDLPDEVEVFDTAGDFFFVTVSAPNQSVLSWMIGSAEPVVDLLTEEGRNGRRTASQNRQISLQQMRTATQEAQFVALTAAGYEPEIEPGPVVVQDILCRVLAEDGFECAEQFPADEVLDPADTILEVDGTPVPTLEDLGAALDGGQPGDVIDLTIDRPGEGVMDVSAMLASDPQNPDRTIIGFVPFDTRTVVLPFDVSIDTQAVGGPSAGLAFTLALVDELTEGELTGGRDIAVTGTIRLDGTVGPIGGLEQKISTVHQHGVEVFLIPAEQFELGEPNPDNPDDGVCRWECLNAAGDGEVVLIPVASLEEALSVLEVLGGDPLVPAEPVDAG
jgi:PDZ domain-containing protein